MNKGHREKHEKIEKRKSDYTKDIKWTSKNKR